MLHQSSSGLQEPLLEARQGPSPDSLRQHQSPTKVAQVIGKEGQPEPHFVRPEPMAAEPRCRLLDPPTRINIDVGDWPKVLPRFQTGNPGLVRKASSIPAKGCCARRTLFEHFHVADFVGALAGPPDAVRIAGVHLDPSHVRVHARQRELRGFSETRLCFPPNPRSRDSVSISCLQGPLSASRAFLT